MSLRALISTKELTFLLATIASSFFIVSCNESLLWTENHYAKLAEFEAQKAFFCRLATSYPQNWSRNFSFIALPIIFFLVWRNTFKLFICSFILLLIPFTSIFYWFVIADHYPKGQHNMVIGDFYVTRTESIDLLFNSNGFDMLFYILISILVAWQLLILFRLALSYKQNKHAFL